MNAKQEVFIINELGQIAFTCQLKRMTEINFDNM